MKWKLLCKLHYLFLYSFELISYFKKQFQSVLEEVKWDKVNSFVDFTNDKKKHTEASISIWSHFISLNSTEILNAKGSWLMIKVTDQFRFWKQDSIIFKQESFSATTKTNAPTNCCYNTSLGKKTIFLQILNIITNIGSSFSTTIGGIYNREVDTGRIM